MADIYETLQRIKARPSMYLGSPSILNLKSFLNGYLYARAELKKSLTEQEQDLEIFQDWIQQNFSVESSQSWAKIILFYSEDEREALNNFFKWLEEFQNRDKK
jgi:hypothetical protein